MPWLFSFDGRVRPLPYAAWSWLILSSQYLASAIALRADGAAKAFLGRWPAMVTLESLYPVPLHPLAVHVWFEPGGAFADLILLLVMAYVLVAAWALAALAFRRASDAAIGGGVTVFVIAPILQLPIVLLLCIIPSRAAKGTAPAIQLSRSDWAAAAQGVVTGMAMTLVAVAVGTLLFGAYGYGLFVVAPLVIGAMTAYVANRYRDLGMWRTAVLVAGATALGGMALVFSALEGLVCIVSASPLAFGVALVGGLLGRAIAVRSPRSAAQTLSIVASLPLVFTVESALNGVTSFATEQTIEISASPAAVWRAILHMDTIDEGLALPFRLGVAYPVRGDIIGEGLGALRRGEFSTGTAVEHVTEWVPQRKLAFVVDSDVPAMRELSPYEHVHAPHVVGYFRTIDTSFELVPRGDNHTVIIERTAHELRLEPVLYWLPLARWVIAQNNARVLAHIRHQAERDGG
jgi:hypothetical protein